MLIEIDMDDRLLALAEAAAVRTGTKVSRLVEEGLQRLLARASNTSSGTDPVNVLGARETPDPDSRERDPQSRLAP